MCLLAKDSNKEKDFQPLIKKLATLQVNYFLEPELHKLSAW